MKHLNNKDVLARTESLAAEERRITAELLVHLREIERRRLYAELGYSSLFEFTVKHLKLSEGAASRRISAMRAIRDCDAEGKVSESPALEAIRDGQMSVSALSTLHGFFKDRERHGGKRVQPDERIKWMDSIRGKSSRECERLMAEAAPEIRKADRERVISSTRVEVKFTMGPELERKLDRIRSLLSHRNPSPTYEELLLMMSDLVLEKLDPELRSSKLKTSKPKSDARSQPPSDYPGPCWDANSKESVNSNASLDAVASLITPASGSQRIRSRAVPADVARAVWQRDQGRCTFQSEDSGHVCGSRHLVQLDHIVPFALGGEHTLSNLRLLCAAHNQWEAKRWFGVNAGRRVFRGGPEPVRA